jgi:hypothetical protein
MDEGTVLSSTVHLLVRPVKDMTGPVIPTPSPRTDSSEAPDRILSHILAIISKSRERMKNTFYPEDQNLNRTVQLMDRRDPDEDKHLSPQGERR